MPLVQINTHGPDCKGSGRVIKARVAQRPHPRSYDCPERFAGKTVSQAWCRWCKNWHSYAPVLGVVTVPRSFDPLDVASVIGNCGGCTIKIEKKPDTIVYTVGENRQRVGAWDPSRLRDIAPDTWEVASGA
jgi:hypothetical protein